MMNIKRNNFWSAAKTIAATLFFGLSIGNAQGVFITEITDPNTNSLATNGGRFVELYNNTDADIDLTGWALRRWTNEQIDPQPSDQVLSGSISAGGFYIITNIAEGFESIYGFAADLAIGSGGPADSNGDDDIALINLAGDVVDFYGEVNTSSGTDNTGTVWEFEDGRAERLASVSSANALGISSEWNIDNDSGGGDGVQDVDNMDPGSWIGEPVEGNSPPVVNLGGDKYISANDNGDIVVVLDGSAAYDVDNDELSYVWSKIPSLEGVGDLPVVELTYPNGTTGVFKFQLAVSDGEYTVKDTIVFNLLNSYEVKFIVDMSEETIDDDGVKITGLGDDSVPMIDENSDGVYSAIVDLFEGDYTYNFRNGWSYESGDNLGNCAGGQYGNDRGIFVDQDMVLASVCWESCGPCFQEPEVPSAVTFILADGADNTLPENQDHITESVKLTRGASGALFNIAIESEYEQGVSPIGTFWAIGLTSDNALDNFASYSNLHDAVNGALNGFSEIEGKTFSMHVAGTDKYFDVTFNSWTNGGSGQGGPATRGFSYTRVAVENNESEGPSFSNYTLMVKDAESYDAEVEATLPPLNVDGQGVVIEVDFDTSGDNVGPYVGALGLFWDANFSGQLDEGDMNIADELFSDEDGEDEGTPNREHDDEDGPAVIMLTDNSPMDESDQNGKAVVRLKGLDFMALQGATFFFAELNKDGELTGTTFKVEPFSSSSTIFTGVASRNVDNTNQPIQGVFVSVEKVDVGFDDMINTDSEPMAVAMGLTGSNGVYSLGASSLMAGDTAVVGAETVLDERLIVLMEDQEGVVGHRAEFITVEGENHMADISVIRSNTLVQGYVTDSQSMSFNGSLHVQFFLGSDENPIMIEDHVEIDEGGMFTFWAMNGAEVELSYYGMSGNINRNFLIEADDTMFSDTIDAYVFNYTLDLTPPSEAVIKGRAFWVSLDSSGTNMDYTDIPLPGMEIKIYNENDMLFATTDAMGEYSINVPSNPTAGVIYFVKTITILPELRNDAIVEVTTYTGTQSEVDFEFFPYVDEYVISGQIKDDIGQGVSDAEVNVSSVDSPGEGDREHENGWYNYTYTDAQGYYAITVPAGIYDMDVIADGFLTAMQSGVDATSDIVVDFNLTPVGDFTGSVQGVVFFLGDYASEDPAYIEISSDSYEVSTYADQDGFYSVQLIDGVYDIYVNAMGYDSYWKPEAFEIMGNTVVFDVELFAYGYANAPHMVDLYDIPNDQGLQMRAVWDAGMPGDYNFFTQFSIWRKVNNAPIELWDYIETVPWHGMDPYAAVVPTLGDSSMHGVHTSTFMVTAHTSDVGSWFDSEPISGHSIDNLHPGTPMDLSFSSSQSGVSLSWSSSTDEDFSYFNIYRQDLLSMESAVVFTSIDSFYTDLEVSSVGSYEYWVTAVDLSGLESEASSFVSAVLSAGEEMGMPVNFALKQNYPNPFNPSTQIQYALPSESKVLISIYDLTGRKVKTLVNEVQSAGHKSVMWNATNEIGRPVSAGMYIYSIQAGNFIQNRKMVLMK